MIDSNCPIWKSGKGFCWAPSAAWGCTDAQLCAACQAKPREIERIVVIPLSAMPRGAELLEERTCRFCGKTNVAANKWRKKDRMCSDHACWERFLKEVKSQPVAV